MEQILCKKEELVKAFQKWNKDVIKNPNNHETPTESLEDAESQAEELLKYLKQEPLIITKEGNPEENSIDYNYYDELLSAEKFKELHVKNLILKYPLRFHLGDVLKTLKSGRTVKEKQLLNSFISESTKTEEEK